MALRLSIVVSPCVTFNNNPGSTKGYEHVRDHLAATGTVDFVPVKREITTSYEPGESQEVTLHDGSVVHLQKADPALDLGSRRSALGLIKDYKAKDQILTGLLFMDEDSRDLHEIIGTSNKPLRNLDESELCPGQKVLDNLNQSLR